MLKLVVVIKFLSPMKFLLVIFQFSLIIFLFTNCQIKTKEKKANDKVKIDYTAFVNPFIGTSKMGHTFPGAAAPFGMVQLSPQTNFVPMFQETGEYNPETYEYCAGYQYKDSTILGFSHTNMSGTGHSDLGDFLVMPTTGELILDPIETENGTKGYYSTFSHETELASPGYYKVDLDSYEITAEMTATERVGVHHYTFPESTDAHILLDLIYNVYHHDDKNVWSFIRVENDSVVTGYRQTTGWGRTRKVFFVMEFSKPFKSYGHKKYDKKGYNGFYQKFNEEENFPEMAGRSIRAYFNFDTKQNETIDVKFALSAVSVEGARKNMKKETKDWTFEEIRKKTKKKWNNELSKIEVESMNEADKTTFYTALYHTMLSPIVFEDVDGKYRGLDQEIHESKGFTNYTLFSLWDTYRALHPLFNITQPKRNNDMIQSMLAHQQQSTHKMLPIWSHYANENWCMIGYHATSVIADAAVKNVGDFDKKQALEACVSTANVRYFDGIGDYIDFGYVPEDKSGSSVSKTLEYAYNDWCIAQLAESVQNDKIYDEFIKRSNYFINVFDPKSGYMRPKLSDGSFREEFDPLDTHGQGFIEGNAWNYGLYVPHQIDKMIAMMGGKDVFSSHLDSLFTMELDDKYIAKNEDITRDGIIGNYVHGNEPGHHIAYLYNWTNHPYKTQERVRMIARTMYTSEVNGLCGNDDAGQMSAWYIFTALGFYPVLPGSPNYAIGSPLVKSATLKLDKKKTLRITVKNQSEKNVYVQSVTFNGKKLTHWEIAHSDLMKGGELVFTMSSKH